MSGNAIRFSRFQDQLASRITASKQSPLRSNTVTLSRTSGQRRNARHSDSSTRETIGTSSFHMLFFTLEKIAEPSNSQPESQTSWAGNSDSRTARRELVSGARLVTGLRKPRARKLVGERATTFSKIHWLIGLV